MRSLRVANINHLCALPYRVLKDVEFIRYEENSAAENGRRLHEGEVDVALISVADFAMHGGYVGLDFGIGFKEISGAVMLCSHVPLAEIETINIYSAASSTAVLLRLLVSTVWKINPLLVRRSKSDLLTLVTGRDASLISEPLLKSTPPNFPVIIDLAHEWYKLTGKPFVPSVWAVRPGALKPDHLRAFNDAFHRAVKARASVAELSGTELAKAPAKVSEYIEDTIEYYFDGPVMEGLEEFLRRAGTLNLLPKNPYRSATLTLIGRHVPRISSEHTVSQILDGVLDGGRLGIRDGVRLAYEASIGDLTLVADTLRKRLARQQVVRPVANLSLCEKRAEIDSFARVTKEIQSLVSAGVMFAKVPSGCSEGATGWLTLLARLKTISPLLLEALSPGEISKLAAASDRTVEKLVSDLVAAGLDIVGGEGGEMLVDRVMAESVTESLSVQEWIGIMRWVHRYGGSSRAIMRVNRHDSWEDRFVHLFKLRTLQDEMPGFRSFTLKGEGRDRLGVETKLPEVKLRCTALARIFLDNITSIEECELGVGDGTAAALSLGAGARDICVPAGMDQEWYEAMVCNLQRVGVHLFDDGTRIVALR